MRDLDMPTDVGNSKNKTMIVFGRRYKGEWESVTQLGERMS